MGFGESQVCARGYLGAPLGVLMRRDLKPGEFNLDGRKLGLVLIFYRERVLDVFAVRLTRVAGQCWLPFILRTPTPSVLVNSAVRPSALTCENP